MTEPAELMTEVFLAVKNEPVPESRADQECVTTSILGAASTREGAQALIQLDKDLWKQICEHEGNEAEDTPAEIAERISYAEENTYAVETYVLDGPLDSWNQMVMNSIQRSGDET